jgi:hypothetical protein
MVPLVVLAGVVWGVAIKRIVDYNRYKNSHKVNRDTNDPRRIDYTKRDFPAVQRKQDLEYRQEQRTPIILIRDSNVYLVKGDGDDWSD